MSDPATAAPTVARARRKFKPLPPIERLRELFELREDGVLIWRSRTNVPTEWNTRFAGKKAGHLGADGRTRVCIDYANYLSSRLVFYMISGRDPEGQLIDHSNRRAAIDASDNLRPCNNSQNMHNRLAQSNNASGFKGVRHHPKCSHRPWAASIQVNGRYIYLGCHSAKSEAERFYKIASAVLCGEFSPYYEDGIREASMIMRNGGHYILDRILKFIDHGVA